MIQAELVREPGPGDHPWLLEAWADAMSPRTAWRLNYQLPPNDPRVLEADEETVLRDLTLIRYHRHRARAAEDPGAAAAENVGERERWRDLVGRWREDKTGAEEVARVLALEETSEVGPVRLRLSAQIRVPSGGDQ